MKFIFLGPPVAGKGTLAAKVAEEYKLPHFYTGDIFREAIKNLTPLGIKVKAIIDSGALVSDDITIELVKDRLSQDDAQNGFILDGFPRTIPQAEALAGIVAIDAAVNFDIADDAVIERLSGRRVCKGCGKNYHVKFMPSQKDGLCDDCNGYHDGDAAHHRIQLRGRTLPACAADTKAGNDRRRYHHHLRLCHRRTVSACVRRNVHHQ